MARLTHKVRVSAGKNTDRLDDYGEVKSDTGMLEVNNEDDTLYFLIGKHKLEINYSELDKMLEHRAIVNAMRERR